jgi:hypothetical protein
MKKLIPCVVCGRMDIRDTAYPLYFFGMGMSSASEVSQRTIHAQEYGVYQGLGLQESNAPYILHA